MYLLIVCAVSWLVLLGSLITAWTGLPQPRTPTDIVVIVVIVVIAAATAVFARLGLVSIVTLLLRTLPDGRVRSLLASFVIRAMPRLLASSALTVVSAGIAVQAGHAATQQDRAGPIPRPVGSVTVAEAPVDPGWPTISDPSPESQAPETDATETPAGDTETPEPSDPTGSRLPDPGWPTERPDDSNPTVNPSPSADADSPDDDSTPAPSEPESSPEAPEPTPKAHEPTIHEVERGESLWSIAETFVDDPDEVAEFVAGIYTANKSTIGPDPSLILAGQRLEIRP